MHNNNIVDVDIHVEISPNVIMLLEVSMYEYILLLSKYFWPGSVYRIYISDICFFFSIKSERGRWALAESAKGGERLKKVEKRCTRS